MTRSATLDQLPDPRRDYLAVLSHVTQRDRAILDLLEDHQVATTDQLARVFFTSQRTCQLRLEILRRMALVDRFRFSRPYGGREHWKWTLGWFGRQLQAAAAQRPIPTERSHRTILTRLAGNPTLHHLLSTNEFFVRLHETARTLPDEPLQLDRWWSETRSSSAFSYVQPDGHGIWTSRGRTVGFFLECDTGTENLSRLTAKIPGYSQLRRTGGPNYPVLFWLPPGEREHNLHKRLKAAAPPEDVFIATSTHDTDPAGAAWLPLGHAIRFPLDELPSDHGINSAGNPNWIDGALDLTNRRPAHQ